MKNLLKVLFIISLIFPSIAEARLPCKVLTKDGTVISVYHFGHMTCGGNKVSNFLKPQTNIDIYGTYNGQTLRILEDYSNIKKIRLTGFSQPQSRRINGNHEEGIITAIRYDEKEIEINGQIRNSCSAGDGMNVLRLVVRHPVTDNIDEIKVEVRNIKEIVF